MTQTDNLITKIVDYCCCDDRHGFRAQIVFIFCPGRKKIWIYQSHFSVVMPIQNLNLNVLVKTQHRSDTTVDFINCIRCWFTSQSLWNLVALCLLSRISLVTRRPIQLFRQYLTSTSDHCYWTVWFCCDDWVEEQKLPLFVCFPSGAGAADLRPAQFCFLFFQ